MLGCCRIHFGETLNFYYLKNKHAKQLFAIIKGAKMGLKTVWLNVLVVQLVSLRFVFEGLVSFNICILEGEIRLGCEPEVDQRGRAFSPVQFAVRETPNACSSR